MDVFIYLLFGVIVLLIAYIAFQDYSNRQEREKLELKLMSKDVTEYKVNTESTPTPMKDEPEIYMDTDDVSPNKLLNAKDSL
jgi:hypothetical protein